MSKWSRMPRTTKDMNQFTWGQKESAVFTKPKIKETLFGCKVCNIHFCKDECIFPTIVDSKYYKL